MKFLTGEKIEIINELENEDYISAMYQTYKTELLQELINNYGYDLVVECMVELYQGRKK